MRGPEVIGRYELVRPLATSGMAELHLAQVIDDGTERRVVVKRLLRHLIGQPGIVEQFLLEARTAASLDHPNIPEVEEIVEGPDDWYYVTDLCAGASLLDCMKVLAMQGRQVPIECAVTIGAEVCAALAYAHDRRDAAGAPLVHRNVSPLNVLLAFDSSIRLGHFGLEGTLGYMSPEQCLGLPVDARSDLFSLGIVLYEVTTGRRLFGSRESEDRITERIVGSDIAPPSRHRPNLPRQLEDVILCALQRDPAARYARARDMQRDLESCVWARRPSPSAGAVGELVRKALFESPAYGTRIVREEDLKTVVRALPPDLLVAAGGAPAPDLELAPERPPRAGQPLRRAVALALALPTVATDVKTTLQTTWRWARRRRWPVVAATAMVVLGLLLSGWAISRAAHVPADLPAVLRARPAPTPIPVPPRTARKPVRAGGSATVPPNSTSAADPSVHGMCLDRPAKKLELRRTKR